MLGFSNKGQSNSDNDNAQGFTFANLKESARVNLDTGRSMWDGLTDKLKDLPETNYQVGQMMVMRGAVKDAVFRFRIALWFDKNHLASHYALGCCYIDLGNKEKAAQHLVRALQIKPAYEEARFMLARIRPDLVPADQRPKYMPTNMLMDYFTVLAPHYDDRQEVGQYNGPNLVEHYLNAELDERRVDYHLLDVGCGTGLIGARLRERMQYITGVDLCRPMLEKLVAKRDDREKQPYDVVVEDTMAAHFQKDTPATIDIITAINTLQYSGDLSAFFEGAKRLLKEKGVLMFTFYPNTQTSDFGLVSEKGYFGHNPSYIEGLATRAGLKKIHHSDAQLYPKVMHTIALYRNDA